MQRLDTQPIDIADGEVLAFACVRNEILRLPWFLDYHRRLGVDRFLLVDNGSTDGTTDLLLSQPRVHVFWTTDSFARMGMRWLNRLLGRHGIGHWTLTLDADELLVYPGCERAGLRALTSYLDRSGAEAMECLMVDMYSAATIRDTPYRPGQSFLEACPYFDDDVLEAGLGGARRRLFWRDGDPVKPPYLRKIPLARWRRGLSFRASTHFLDDARLSQVRGALLHFKLFNDFHEKVAIGVAENQHWKDSREYRHYLAAIEENPDLRPFYEGSIRFRDSQQLVDLGIMRKPQAYDDYLAALPPPR
jgi:hypothetical protein